MDFEVNLTFPTDSVHPSAVFFPVIIKNSNWEILPKNLVAFKR